MVTIDQLKAKFDERGLRYSKELTSGNYDDEGKLIDKKILTLTTEYCEIGFNDRTIYLVFIIQSDSWTKEFFDEIKKFSNLQIYGFRKFLKNYDLTNNPESDIKSESRFQMQFSFKINDLTTDQLMTEYESLIKLMKDHKIKLIDQLRKMVVS